MSVSVEIEKTLGSFHLEVSFAAGDETLALLGASGCGKSMTLKCIAGIERPDRGRIVVDGRTVFDSAGGIDLPPQQRHVGVVFQNYALFPNMTVLQNIRAGARREGEMRQVIRRFGKSVLLVSYDRDEVFHMAHSIAVMDQGRGGADRL
ncbi:MAG: ATP-binding cassette domain-containing protein [Oscillospiraceae bacterium]|nr:ATP-binding cassette domain-containing protein [Oscillospiraceae bacterium]